MKLPLTQIYIVFSYFLPLISKETITFAKNKIMSKELSYKIEYLIACIGAFADKFKMTNQSAYHYLSKYKALDFLNRFYDVEHTQSIDDAVEDMITISRRNGGQLA